MSKQIHTSTLQLFERIIGPTTTSLAQKKARLIFAAVGADLEIPASDYPVCYPLEGTGFQLINHANVFSRDQLDIGTRLLLAHIPASDGYRDIVDLGCGNGVVGLMAAQQNPAATLHFVDESAMAVASAQATLAGSGLANPAHFSQGDALSGFPPASADLILCNPPFHQAVWWVTRLPGACSIRRAGCCGLVVSYALSAIAISITTSSSNGCTAMYDRWRRIGSLWC